MSAPHHSITPATLPLTLYLLPPPLYPLPPPLTLYPLPPPLTLYPLPPPLKPSLFLRASLDPNRDENPLIWIEHVRNIYKNIREDMRDPVKDNGHLCINAPTASV